jgi:hypothetical protein
MDRSYPYSRRLMSRARLRKRMVAATVAGLAAATALFMLTWKADPISAAVAPSAQPLLALAGAAGNAPSRGVRRIYPYSIVPGGVSGPAELARVIRTDRVVATHYASFDVDRAHAVVVEKPRAVHVSYRKGGKVYWTARKVMLAEGETLLSDGRNEMRARCANRISDVPQYPVEAHQPSMEELDNPVDVDEGDQVALGVDGLPVSIDPTTGLPRQSGHRFPIRGGSGFLTATTGSAPADTLLASTSFPSSTASNIPVTTMAYSGSSSSVGSRPRPDSDAPVAPPATSTGSEGSSGSSSGSPAPGAGTDTQTGTPAPESNTTPPAVETPPPTGTPVQEPTPGPQPDPTPTPTPQPDTQLPPVFTPEPVPQPGGGTGELPPTTPTAPGPLFPEPVTETEPFIPKPGLTPPPGTSTDAPEKPADVPEPGSFWLGGIGLAALCLLRRRPGTVKRES